METNCVPTVNDNGIRRQTKQRKYCYYAIIEKAKRKWQTRQAEKFKDNEREVIPNPHQTGNKRWTEKPFLKHCSR